VNSYEKVVALIKQLGKEPYVHKLNDLAEAIDCGKSGTFKILTVLINAGIVEQKEDKSYTLGIANVTFGKIYQEKIGGWTFCTPFLRELRDATGENASFGVWRNDCAVPLLRERSFEFVGVVATPIGSPVPINAAVMGKVIGAYLSDEERDEHFRRHPITRYTDNTVVDKESLFREYEIIRNRGYGVTCEEFHPGVFGVGVPVFDSENCFLGAIAVSLPAFRASEEKIQFCVEQAKKTANRIQQQLKGQ